MVRIWRVERRGFCFPEQLANLPFTPIDLEGTAALVQLFTHWIVDGDGQYFTTARTLHFRGTGDGFREAEFVGDEVARVEH